MFQFLNECNKYNIYERAQDCEQKINSFDCVTPMAVFFETIFKAIYGECSQKYNYKGNLNNLLQNIRFVKYLKDEYHFDEVDVVNEIRQDSNTYKHTSAADKVKTVPRKKYFQCVYSFARCFFYRVTGHEAPVWSSSKYNQIVSNTQNVSLSAPKELELNKEIEKLNSKLDKEQKDKIDANKEIERLSNELKEVLFEHVKKSDYEILQRQYKDAVDSKSDIERQVYLLSKKNQELEATKESIQQDKDRVQYEIVQEQEDTKIIKELEEKQGAIETELHNINSENKKLIKLLADKEQEIKRLSKDRVSLGKASADLKRYNELQTSLRDVEKKRDDITEEVAKTQKELEDLQSKLYFTNNELDKGFAQYKNIKLEIDKLNMQKKSFVDAYPHCPQCNAVLAIRKGKYGEFWGCTNYSKRSNKNKCSFTRNITAEERAIFCLDSTKNAEITRCNQLIEECSNKLKQLKKKEYKQKSERVNKCVTYKAYPYSLEKNDPCAYMFQSLRVPKEVFDLKEEDKGYKLLKYFSRFIMLTNINKTEISTKERSIYSLTLRLLNRGFIVPSNGAIDTLLKKKFDLKPFGRVQSLFDSIYYDNPENIYDSPIEQEFANYYLKRILGDNWATYTLNQVGFDLLCPDDENERFAKQRVDFLVQKNNQQIVIEIDGPEHFDKRDADQARDNFLRGNNFVVLRFSNKDVLSHSTSIEERLREAIQKPNYKEFYTEIDDKYLVATKILHQLEIGIVKGLEQGYIPKCTNLKVSGTVKLFSESELNFLLAIATEELKEIFRNYALIYNQRVEFNFFNTDCETINICIGNGDLSNSMHITLRDTYLNFNCLCDIAPFDINILPVNCSIAAIEYFLNYIFGYEHLRDGQFAAIERLILRNDSIILLPTGAGKSIIYQLSSYLVPGITVIISPLKALMEDQVSNLDIKFGINGAIAIMSTSGRTETINREKKLRAIKHNSLAMLYIAPERLQLPSFRLNVQNLMQNNYVYSVAIDEAHCVSEWGHDFRPAYLNIANAIRVLFRKENFIPSITALTGTASEHVLKDVKKCLEIGDEDAVIMPSTFDRNELHFAILKSAIEDKQHSIATIIKKMLPQKFGSTYEDFAKLDSAKTKSGIVFTQYAASKKPSSYDALGMSWALSNMLPEMGIKCFFSKVPDDYEPKEWEDLIRKNALDFKRDKINVIVATKAYGMGIDKSNVRFIIHDGIPTSLEAYYQEAGRAGRGRESSYCYLVFSNDKADVFEQLLDSEQSIEDMKNKYEGAGNVKDDLGVILYFHTQTYAGIQSECDTIDNVLSFIDEKNYSNGKVVTIYNKNRSDSNRDINKDWMLAMIRLINLGVIVDYTYDYNNKFEVTCGSIDRESIANHFVAHVSADNMQRRGEAKRNVGLIQGEGYVYLKQVVRLLIEYNYDNIEKSRRNAMRLMYNTVKEAAEKEGKEQEDFFRQAILSYFSVGKRTTNLSALLNEKDAGLSKITTLLKLKKRKKTISNAELVKFRDVSYKVGRILESTPDQPALILIRSLCEMYLKSAKVENIAKNIVMAIKYARERYSVGDSTLIPEMVNILIPIFDYNGGLLDEVIRLLEKYRNNFFSNILDHMLGDKRIDDETRDILLLKYLKVEIDKAIEK